MKLIILRILFSTLFFLILVILNVTNAVSKQSQ